MRAGAPAALELEHDVTRTRSHFSIYAMAFKKADLFKIQAGKERYEIPEAAVFGG